jgi:hypothetical protein
VHIEAQDIAEQVVVVLARAERITTPAAIAERGVEIAVAPEAQPAALVICQAIGLIDPDDKGGACGIDAVGIGCRNLIAAYLGVVAGIGDVDVDVSIGGEIRIECETMRPPSPITAIELAISRNGAGSS